MELYGQARVWIWPVNSMEYLWKSNEVVYVKEHWGIESPLQVQGVDFQVLWGQKEMVTKSEHGGEGCMEDGWRRSAKATAIILHQLL